MKLLNNYPKWFEITNCKANEVMQLCNVPGKTCDRGRVFSTDTDYVIPSASGGDLQWVNQGHNASYGICFRDAEVWLSGVHLTPEQRSQIQAITLCAKTIGDPQPTCQNLPPGLPTVSRRVNTSSTATWNFADQILSYWPQNYIKPNMWDLTHYDYDDNWYDKAYKYHMDNNVPKLGARDGIVKPENVVAFPLFKVTASILLHALPC